MSANLSLSLVFQDVVLSFTGRQQGNFRVRQKLDVLGDVVQRAGNVPEEAPGLELRSFHTITLQLSAVCQTRRPSPKLSPGECYT